LPWPAAANRAEVETDDDDDRDDRPDKPRGLAAAKTQ
jgi:hypothetical protein